MYGFSSTVCQDKYAFFIKADTKYALLEYSNDRSMVELPALAMWTKMSACASEMGSAAPAKHDVVFTDAAAVVADSTSASATEVAAARVEADYSARRLIQASARGKLPWLPAPACAPDTARAARQHRRRSAAPGFLRAIAATRPIPPPRRRSCGPLPALSTTRCASRGATAPPWTAACLAARVRGSARCCSCRRAPRSDNHTSSNLTIDSGRDRVLVAPSALSFAPSALSFGSEPLQNHSG